MERNVEVLQLSGEIRRELRAQRSEQRRLGPFVDARVEVDYAVDLRQFLGSLRLQLLQICPGPIQTRLLAELLWRWPRIRLRSSRH